MTKNRNKKTILYKGAAILLALLLWQGISMFVNMEMLLASPMQVIVRLLQLCTEGQFLSTVGYSFARISLGFLCAFAAGIVMAIAAGRYRVIEYMLWPYLITVKSVPVASFIILCLIWLTFGQLTVFISFLIAFPVVYGNVLQGIRNANRGLWEVAEIYHVPWNRRLLYLYIPEIKPYLISACNIGIGMAWKSGVAAEVIGVVSGSIGGKLYDAKIYFQNADLLAWTIVIILISVLSEKLFMLLLRGIFKRIERL